VSSSRAQGLDGVTPVDDVPAAFAATVQEAFTRRSGATFSLVLSGGPTARACYEHLAALPAGSIDWDAVDIYIGDERGVAPDDEDANQRLARESLIEPVGGVHAFFPMPTDGPLAHCAQRYDEVLHAALAVDAFDLVHLGLGPDVHTASLFPGSKGLDAPEDVYVVANTDPTGNNRHERLTITFSAIAHLRLCVVTVMGESKRDAVRALLDGEDLPAGRVRSGEVRWLLDEAALGSAVPR